MNWFQTVGGQKAVALALNYLKGIKEALEKKGKESPGVKEVTEDGFIFRRGVVVYHIIPTEDGITLWASNPEGDTTRTYTTSFDMVESDGFRFDPEGREI